MYYFMTQYIFIILRTEQVTPSIINGAENSKINILAYVLNIKPIIKSKERGYIEEKSGVNKAQVREDIDIVHVSKVNKL